MKVYVWDYKTDGRRPWASLVGDHISVDSIPPPGESLCIIHQDRSAQEISEIWPSADLRVGIVISGAGASRVEQSYNRGNLYFRRTPVSALDAGDEFFSPAFRLFRNEFSEKGRIDFELLEPRAVSEQLLAWLLLAKAGRGPNHTSDPELLRHFAALTTNAGSTGPAPVESEVSVDNLTKRLRELRDDVYRG